MPWVETTNSGGSGDRDVPGRGSIERTFRVWDVSPSVAIRNPAAILNEGGFGLPALNSVHPDLPGWFLDRYRLGGRTASTFDLGADYSNDRRFQFREVIDPTREGFYSWGVSFRSGTLDIPYVTKGHREIVLSGGPPPVTAIRQPWEKQVWKSPLRYTTITLRLNIPEFGGAQRRLIEAQTGKVHEIEGLPYLFEAGDAVQAGTTPMKWTVEYNWTSDPGLGASPFPDAVLTPTKRVHGPQQIYNSAFPALQHQRWTRHPFDEIIGPIPPENGNPETVPTFDVVYRHEFDHNDWRTLPGIRP